MRKKVVGVATRPRLCVHKSLKHLYVTVVDDTSQPDGCLTLFTFTTNTRTNKESGKKSFRNTTSAKVLGEAAAKALKEKGISRVVFDRDGYRYHGVVKAICEAIRAAGIKV